jgi:hypothetical protein
MKKLFLRLLLVLLIPSILVPSLAQAQNYALTWWTVDGGGGTSSGDGYTLSGTIGQPDAGILSGGNYILSGGFWGNGSQHFIHLPLILRN